MIERYLPPGRIEGSRQPIVEVTHTARNTLGTPEVNYPLLNTLMRNDFAIPERITPRVVLFGESGWGIPSFHVPLTPTIHINAARCEFKKQQTGNEHLTATLLGLSQQLQVSANTPHYALIPYALLPAAIALEELALRFALSPVAEDIGNTGKRLLELATVGAAIGKHIHNRLITDRLLHSSDQESPLIQKYKETIVFPRPTTGTKA